MKEKLFLIGGGMIFFSTIAFLALAFIVILPWAINSFFAWELLEFTFPGQPDPYIDGKLLMTETGPVSYFWEGVRRLIVASAMIGFAIMLFPVLEGAFNTDADQAGE